jgi:dolichol-phosphate mannosyltransferase
MNKKVSIIIPAYNEEDTIPLIYEQLYSIFNSNNLDLNYEIIFIDDGSTDGTSMMIRQLKTKDKNVKGILLSRNFGHQAAITAGMDYATGDFIISMDCDLQHPPQKIMELFKYANEGYDIVYTIRKETGDITLFKRISSKLFYWIMNHICDVNINENAADFRLITKKVQSVFKDNIRERNRFIRGLITWVGFKSIGIEYIVQKRVKGTSKYTFKKMFTLAFTGIVSFSTFPLKLGLYLGTLLGIFSLSYSIYALYMVLLTDKTVPGWASLFILMSFLGAIQCFLIGLIGLYISFVFEEVKNRPIYLIDDYV